MAGNLINIIIADDHSIFRDGLSTVLSQIESFNVLAEAETGKELLSLLDKYSPDIILMDISMPEMDGIEATEKALDQYPTLKIITLSSYSDHIYYYRMIKAGVQGFVLKKSGKDELETAIKNVYSGQNHFPQDILRNLIFKLGDAEKQKLNDDQLMITKRESEVLTLICNGLTNNEIANKLHLSPKTVDNHRTSLLSKTNTKNSAHLVMFAIKNHLIEI